jgi:hypothetical protein
MTRPQRDERRVRARARVRVRVIAKDGEGRGLVKCAYIEGRTLRRPR